MAHTGRRGVHADDHTRRGRRSAYSGLLQSPLGGGFEEGKDAWRALTARFPDMRVVVQDILVDGDRAAVRSTVEGIATADGARPMLFEIFRFDNGRFAESWGASTGLPASAGPEDLLT
ncbi:MAG: nuclear transport factor 2 family protein [Streptosporangiales bacterium]|nr:nuclear transport factor 2 family protein [Streptosporangiales bacterium]